jgi:membrane-associated phospholipid phosphatase
VSAAVAALLPPLLLCALALTVLGTGANVLLFLALRARLLPWGEGVWSGLTLLGDALVGPLLIVPFLRRQPGLIWAGTLAAAAATAYTHVLKPLVHMPRPPAVLDGLAVIGVRLTAGSFPSGHTATAFTVLGLLLLSGAVRGTLPVLAATALAVLVGLSRIVVGVHWPADVLAGAAGGWCSAWLGLWLARRWPIQPGGLASGALPALLSGIALVGLFGHDTGYPAGLWLQHSVALLALAGLAWQALDRAE